MKPFIKWAGGKRWLTDRPDFEVPDFRGRYIEPFVGGAAVFFYLRPARAVLSDINPRLIETYRAVAARPELVARHLRHHHRAHSLENYYSERARKRKSPAARAAQFLYLNRTCWNGLYRENLKGEFNVPIGNKTAVYDESEDFAYIATALNKARILCQDFEDTINDAGAGDFVFIDPPYTTAHNVNGFIKYNQRIFSWQDQCRLQAAAFAARDRGARVIVTNANHASILDLYKDAKETSILDRRSVISGVIAGRKSTTELLIKL
ncbi:Dam family site-specific DNA-(adenine-N6)-methyltransferase [Luteimonas sp. MJ204]|uniref:DNA adenine methylase n=1 Tax=Luteimonas sp. MJ145 TaxID=3129234 RepID=UPI0031BABE14